MRKPTAQEVRKQQWKQLIIACNNSGMSKKKWCAENGINEKSFYYYQKILRNEVLEEYTEEPSLPSFVDVTSNLQPIQTLLQIVGYINLICILIWSFVKEI